MLLRRDLIVRVLAGGDHPLPAAAATVLAVGTAAFLGPALGVVGASVLDRMESELQYVLTSFGLATMVSAMALAWKTPLLGEKIVLNYALAIALGIVMPRLIAG